MDKEKVETEVKETEVKKEKAVKAQEVKTIDMTKLSVWLRFALMKSKIRNANLQKEEAGYKSQYFYISLQDMQKVFVKLEEEHFLTSVYTEETKVYDNPHVGIVFKNYAVRTLYDLLTGQKVTETRIDITNLKQISDPYLIKTKVLDISEPKDAWKTLYLDFFEPQNLGAISTYFQRYTYNQLYDFQETKEDKIEKKGKLEGELKVSEEATEKPKKETKETKTEKPEKTAKETRLTDENEEMRTLIKKEFEVANIRTSLTKLFETKKFKDLTKEELANLYADLNENFEKKN